MPLIVICGPPCSLKTSCAQAIAKHLKATGCTVQIVNEESIHHPRSVSHASPENEKVLRQALRATVDRLLSRNVVVIADGLNDLRSLRYEWYCVARAVPTAYCVLLCNASLDNARERNNKRIEMASSSSEMQKMKGKEEIEIEDNGATDSYDDEVFESVYSRFEYPQTGNPNRWDRPLFIFESDGAADLDKLDLEGISAAALKTKALRTHESTRPEPQAVIYSLDKVTREIASNLAKRAISIAPGERVSVPHASEPIVFGRPVTAAEIKSLRRDFMRVAERRGSWTGSAAANTFVKYINQAMS